MRIGIMGGSFNPITTAHLTMIEAAKIQLKLDKVLVIPANIPYFKDQDTIAPAKDRLTMATSAVFGSSHVVPSAMEIERGGNSYTIDTIKELRKTYPDDELFLILGADALASIDKWKQFKEIFSEVTLVVFSRDQVDEEAMWKQVFYLTRAYNARITTLDTFIPNISATTVRQLIKEGKSFKYLVSDPVYNYIADHKLYGYRSENYEQV